MPFSSFSATDLTQEGYVGCSVEDIFKPLLDRFGWDAVDIVTSPIQFLMIMHSLSKIDG